jgi:hypothetical protein
MDNYSLRKAFRASLVAALLALHAPNAWAQPVLCDGDTASGSSDFVVLSTTSVRFSATTRINHTTAHPTCFGSMWVRVTVNGVAGTSGYCPSATNSDSHVPPDGTEEVVAQTTCNAPAYMQLCGEFNYRAQGEHRWNDQALAFPNDYTVSAIHYRDFCQSSCPDQCNLSTPEDCGSYEFCSITGPTDYCSYAAGCPAGESAEGSCCVLYGSPVVIDVNGDGIHLTGPEEGVEFALGPSSLSYRVSWTRPASDDAWLVLDRNGNGTIDNGLELFGNHTPQPPPPPGEVRNGFLALMVFDRPANGGDGNSLIDRNDSVFNSLRLWQDVNHNGVSEPSELHELKSLGVESISVYYQDSRRRDRFGNGFRYRAEVKSARRVHTGRWAWDVLLRVLRVSSR